jgi:polygalacturonase
MKNSGWKNGLINKSFFWVFLFIQVTLSGQELELSWVDTAKILSAVREPVFKEKTYPITDYGAIGDGSTHCTEAINKAISQCSEGGGGIVVVPGGKYITGPIHLKSNVNLHLDDNAVLLFSTDPNDYLPVVLTRWEGVDCYNYSPLIYAYQQQNIAITGKGILDGQADSIHWWPWKGKKSFGWNDSLDSQLNDEGREMLMTFDSDQVPVKQRVMGEGHFLRPPFIQFIQCQNILIEDITIHNAPFWQIHPLLSENITIRRVNANSTGPNNDGCDPESCKNVLIENCYFNTGDDCIAIKSGRNNDGRRWEIPSENIVIRNCEMKAGHGGVVIGSEISGGCRNVFVTDCRMNSPNLDRAVRIKTNALRGGTIENIFVRNLEIGQVKEAVLKINCLYETNSETGDYPPSIHHICLENITSARSIYPIYIIGMKKYNCISDIFVKNSHFNGTAQGNRINGVENIKFDNVFINGKKYENAQ